MKKPTTFPLSPSTYLWFWSRGILRKDKEQTPFISSGSIRKNQVIRSDSEAHKGIIREKHNTANDHEQFLIIL